MKKRQRPELTVADHCRKNHWVCGTVLRAIYLDWGNKEICYFRITAIGETEVLCIEMNLPPKTASGERLLPLHFPGYSNWKKFKK